MKDFDFSTVEARHSFYQSKEWQRTRAIKLLLNPLCQHCLDRENRATIADCVHHIRDIKIAPHLRLDLNNLQSLCTSCHAKHTVAEQLGTTTDHKPVNKTWQTAVLDIKKQKNYRERGSKSDTY